MGRGRRGWQWALQDVELQAEPGDSIGLIGANGSGKTTFLKILTRVMYPYAGRVDVAGRVGALIDVRAGIHPELTGRENTYMMGSLLGLKRREVVKRFDEIVAFAELEAAIDRQVKFFSTGMSMRLGFAIAAFLEPDVLLVDEALAVGDASFQQKCLDRMREVLSQGTTLVFVSHDLAAVEGTCRRGIWLRDGRIEVQGTTSEAVGAFRRSIEQAAMDNYLESTNGLIRLITTDVNGVDGSIRSQGPLHVKTIVDSSVQRSGNIVLGVTEGTASPVLVFNRPLVFAEGRTEVRCSIPFLPLPQGRFYVWIGVFDQAGRDLRKWSPVAPFDVLGPDADRPPAGIVRLAPVHVEAQWESARL
jgi:ABC-2 type transport system ATP-binding protein